MVNPNKKLICELSQKLASKYLYSCQNNFTELIQKRFSIVNDQLILISQPEYLVSEVHAKRGFFVYKDQLNSMRSFPTVEKSSQQVSLMSSKPPDQ